MEVTCTCGSTFEARHAKARYCSDRCRKRKGKEDQLAEVKPLPAREMSGAGVESATVRALEDAGRLDTPLGQACLVLARRLDSPGVDTGSAVAAVARQLEALLTTATRGTGAATAPQQLRDELAERRRKHGA